VVRLWISLAKTVASVTAADLIIHVATMRIIVVLVVKVVSDSAQTYQMMVLVVMM
jgi:hypothetical protein